MKRKKRRSHLHPSRERTGLCAGGKREVGAVQSLSGADANARTA
jgi:hypothetical protein